MRLHLWIVLAILLAGGAAAAGPECRLDPRLVGSCFLLRGRIAVHANMRPYLWPVGTRRLIGIADPDGAIVMPPQLERLFANANGLDRVVFGDFEVCPFTRRQPRLMQMACIARARHLVIRDTQQQRR